jgi:hypothetical protein
VRQRPPRQRLCSNGVTVEVDFAGSTGGTFPKTPLNRPIMMLAQV